MFIKIEVREPSPRCRFPRMESFVYFSESHRDSTIALRVEILSRSGADWMGPIMCLDTFPRSQLWFWLDFQLFFSSVPISRQSPPRFSVLPVDLEQTELVECGVLTKFQIWCVGPKIHLFLPGVHIFRESPPNFKLAECGVLIKKVENSYPDFQLPVSGNRQQIQGAQSCVLTNSKMYVFASDPRFHFLFRMYQNSPLCFSVYLLNREQIEWVPGHCQSWFSTNSRAKFVFLTTILVFFPSVPIFSVHSPCLFDISSNPYFGLKSGQDISAPLSRYPDALT